MVHHVAVRRAAVGHPGATRRLGKGAVTVAAVDTAEVTREVLQPGWRWSVDVRPLVGTDLCRAFHQLVVVSGTLRFLLEDGTELVVRSGDVATVPPGHDAWVVGEEVCELVDLSSDYVNLIAAGEAYRLMTAVSETGARCSRSQAAARLQAEAAAGRFDPGAVELVLGAVGHVPRRRRGPAGLSPRETEVLVLIATGASAKQVAAALGITTRTATTHIERIYTKCGVSSRSDATRFAIAHGLVEPFPPRP